jgi:hypothetical protein
MIKLIRFLITGAWHDHQYEFCEEIKIFDPENRAGRPVAILRVRQCKCGATKKTRIQG